jgi:hypothetical protein
MQISDEILSAYVDGELDAQAQADVANATANDTAIARRLAQLSVLKATLPDAMPTMPYIDLDEVHPATIVTTTTNDDRSWRRYTIAASFAAFTVAGALLVGYLAYFGDHAASQTWQQAALIRHSQLAENSTKSEHMPAGILEVITRTPGFTAPDLSAGRLSLKSVDQVTLGAVDAIHFRYAGTRGCQLSLFVMASEQSTDARAIWQTSVRAAQWQTHERRFLLLASGMDIARFDHLARTIKTFTREPVPFSKQTHAQLASARKLAAPCVG